MVNFKHISLSVGNLENTFFKFHKKLDRVQNAKNIDFTEF